MEYDVFLKFCRDFGIFPDLCSKTILHTTFYSLTNENKSISGAVSQKSGKVYFNWRRKYNFAIRSKKESAGKWRVSQ